MAEDIFQAFMASTYMGNAGRSYLEALVIFLICIVALFVFKTIILIQLKALAKKTTTDLDDYLVRILEGLGWPFYILVSFNISARYLTLSETAHKILNYLLMIVVAYYIVKSIMLVIDVFAQKYIARVQKTEKDHDPSIIHVMTMLMKIGVWIVAGIFVVSNLGVNISAFVAGLGIGGIAIAFALQNVLSDIFASFSIYFDKPFKVGDTIQIGADTGIVKKIGIKTTRLESAAGPELIVSNKELTTVRINNLKKAERRRQTFTFGLTYDTEQKKLKRVPELIKEIFKEVPSADLDRVHLKALGDSSLIFEISYLVKKPDMAVVLDAQNDINYKLIERFEKERITFAYPTQTIEMRKR